LEDRRKPKQGAGTTADAVMELSWTMPARSVSPHAIQRMIVRDGEAMLQALLQQAGPNGLVQISLRIAYQAHAGSGGEPAWRIRADGKPLDHRSDRARAAAPSPH
jgi:hypothetical protein